MGPFFLGWQSPFDWARIRYSLSEHRFEESPHAATECPTPTRSDPRTAHPDAGLPRLRPGRSGRPPRPGGPSPPWTAWSGCGSRSAAAATPTAPAIRACLRPEQEGRFALPQHEFGLDVIALVGRLRHAEHRSVPEIHAELIRRGVPICVRSVGNLLDRYDELLALSLLRRRPAAAGHRARPGG